MAGRLLLVFTGSPVTDHQSLVRTPRMRRHTGRIMGKAFPLLRNRQLSSIHQNDLLEAHAGISILATIALHGLQRRARFQGFLAPPVPEQDEQGILETGHGAANRGGLSLQEWRYLHAPQEGRSGGWN